MRRLSTGLLVLSLAGLAAPAARADEVPKFLDVKAKLAKLFKQRVRVKTAAALALTPGGKEVSKTHAYEDLVVVEEAADHSTVRVVASNGYVRLAFYVDPQALPMVARRGANIVASAAGAVSPAKLGAKTPGVRLPAGTPLTAVDASAGGATHVRYVVDKRLTVEGFLPDASVGRAFIPEPALRTRSSNIEVPTPVTVLDAPGGATLATITDTGSGVAARLAAAKDGYMLVQFDSGPAIVIGYVKADGVTKFRPGKFGFGAGPGKMAGYGQAIHLGPSHAYRIKPGDLLFAEPGGPPVGVALSEIAVTSDAPDPEGYWALDVPGPYGMVTILVKRRTP